MVVFCSHVVKTNRLVYLEVMEHGMGQRDPAHFLACIAVTPSHVRVSLSWTISAMAAFSLRRHPPCATFLVAQTRFLATRALEGFRVLELASVLAGPSVGQFLAELGADVIKVENKRTQGDVTRGWRLAGESKEGASAYFSTCNMGEVVSHRVTLNVGFWDTCWMWHCIDHIVSGRMLAQASVPLPSTQGVFAEEKFVSGWPRSPMWSLPRTSPEMRRSSAWMR